MKNLVKIDLRYKSEWNQSTKRVIQKRAVDVEKFLETVGDGNQERIDILNYFVSKFELFAIDLETLELTAGYTTKESYLNEDYYRRFEENQFLDLSDNMMYMEYEYLCIWDEKKLWGKLKKQLGDGYTINWEMYPLWGSRKARIVDLLLDD